MPRVLLLAALALIVGASAFPQSAPAQVTQIRWAEIDNGAGAGDPNVEFDPARQVTNDLLLDFDGRYVALQLLVNLRTGSIFHHPLVQPPAFPPHDALFHLFPAAEFDSFMANGHATIGGPFGDPLITGAAGKLGGSILLFDQRRISLAIGPPPEIPIFDQQNFLAARVTLSDNATGDWTVYASASFAADAGVTPIVLAGDIAAGRMTGRYQALGGDFDRSGTVEQGDLDLVLLHWGEPALPLPAGFGFEVPPSGSIDQDELDAVLLKWGVATEAAAVVAAVPEPSAGFLCEVAIALASLCWARRRTWQ